MKNSIRSFLSGALAASVALFLIYFISIKNTEPPVLETKKSAQEKIDLQTTCSQFCKDRPDLLPPPIFDKSIPEIIKADNDKGVFVKWIPVAEATRYRAILFDLTGERVKSLSTVQDHLYMPRLPSSTKGKTLEYFIALVSIDRNEQEGRMGEKRKVMVSGSEPLVLAPTIKSIRVED